MLNPHSKMSPSAEMEDDGDDEMEDDKKVPDNPNYIIWENKSRQELKERQFLGMKKREKSLETLIAKVIDSELEMLSIKMENKKLYVLNDVIMDQVKKCIDEQIDNWKGLRWWRFKEKNKKECDSYSKWFKKAKCWQDQNQHKPLGNFWSLALASLTKYCDTLASKQFAKEESKQRVLSQTLFHKCMEAILAANVRFARTRETPLLPVRALSQSKELQHFFENEIDSGFTVLKWKEQATEDQKKVKKLNANGNRRSNVALKISHRCQEYAAKLHKRAVEKLIALCPELNVDMDRFLRTNNNNIKHHPNNNNSDKSRFEKETVSRTLPPMISVLPPHHPPPISNMNNTNTQIIGYGPSHGVPRQAQCASYRHSPISIPHARQSRSRQPHPPSANDPILEQHEELKRQHEALKKQLFEAKRQLKRKEQCEMNKANPDNEFLRFFHMYRLFSHMNKNDDNNDISNNDNNNNKTHMNGNVGGSHDDFIFHLQSDGNGEQQTFGHYDLPHGNLVVETPSSTSCSSTTSVSSPPDQNIMNLNGNDHDNDNNNNNCNTIGDDTNTTSTGYSGHTQQGMSYFDQNFNNNNNNCNNYYSNNYNQNLVANNDSNFVNCSEVCGPDRVIDTRYSFSESIPHYNDPFLQQTRNFDYYSNSNHPDQILFYPNSDVHSTRSFY